MADDPNSLKEWQRRGEQTFEKLFPQEAIAALKAENERLRKALDFCNCDCVLRSEMKE